MMIRALIFLSGLLTTGTAFVANVHNPPALTRLYSATGGWGIGQSRELTDAEMAKAGERRAFDGYQLRERGEFLQALKEERSQMKKDEIDELLGVAKIAGLDVKPSNKFDDEVLDEDDDDLDVSVQWDEDDTQTRDADGESITRMDEDTGALGVW